MSVHVSGSTACDISLTPHNRVGFINDYIHNTPNQNVKLCSLAVACRHLRERLRTANEFSLQKIPKRKYRRAANNRSHNRQQLSLLLSRGPNTNNHPHDRPHPTRKSSRRNYTSTSEVLTSSTPLIIIHMRTCVGAKATSPGRVVPSDAES